MATAAPAPAAVAAAPAPPAASPVRTAVIAYFKAVDAIHPEGSGDPDTVAQEVAGGLAKGDTSGIDRMLQQSEATRARLQAITPPAVCAAYHQSLLASLDDGMDMLRLITRATSSSAPSTSTSDLTDRANAMKARSEALQLQEKKLRQQYCE